VLFCGIDSKAKGWKYGNLREQKGLRGIPSLAFLEADGSLVIYVPPKKRTVAGIHSTGERAAEFLRLRAATAGGDHAAAAQFLVMQLEERQVTLDDAVARRARVEPTKDQATTLDRMILHLRISTEMAAKGQKRRHELGPRFLEMWTNGPKPGLDVSRGFWFAILEWAERERRTTEFATALEGLRRSVQHSDPGALWIPNLLVRYEKILDRLQTAKSNGRV
jgi:hypothetical protein